MSLKKAKPVVSDGGKMGYFVSTIDRNTLSEGGNKVILGDRELVKLIIRADKRSKHAAKYPYIIKSGTNGRQYY